MFFPSTVFHSVQFGGQFALRMRCILAVYHNLGYVALNFKCAYQCDGLQALGYVAQETARLDQSKHLATWSWFGAIHLAGVHFPVPGATEYQQSVWTSETARAWKLAGAASRLFLVWNAESFRHAHCFFRSPCSTSWQDLVLTWHPDKQQGPEGRFAAEVGVSMCQPVFFFSPCIVSGISSIDGAENRILAGSLGCHWFKHFAVLVRSRWQIWHSSRNKKMPSSRVPNMQQPMKQDASLSFGSTVRIVMIQLAWRL